MDVHVHMREPGAVHKEDWDSGTASALAGGFTAVLAMPNTRPPVIDAESLESALALAQRKARCDFAQFVGAGAENTHTAAKAAPYAAGLKMYLDATYGPLRLDLMSDWYAHLSAWPSEYPVCSHSEGRTLAAMILAADLTGRPVHFCHVSQREEILLIKAAKEKGIPVTCEVTPHHLFLSDQDIPSIGKGRAEVRPILGSPQDVQALWDNLSVIDCFATDHAPHTLAEKDGENPPPGFPGLETHLPLLLNAVHEKRLSIEDIILRCYTNPRKIFGLPEQPDTWVEADLSKAWILQAKNFYSRSGWTPYEGMQVYGMVQKVILHGTPAFLDGQVLAALGSGRNLRQPMSQPKKFSN